MKRHRRMKRSARRLAAAVSVCLVLPLPVAAAAEQTRPELDPSVIARHRALGRLQEPGDRGSKLGDLQVSVDRAVIRRHRALGRLPERLATSASKATPTDENTAFEWGDAAIGFGIGVGTAGLAIAIAGQGRRLSAAARPKPEP
jgi:hypothetical protein